MKELVLIIYSVLTVISLVGFLGFDNIAVKFLRFVVMAAGIPHYFIKGMFLGITNKLKDYKKDETLLMTKFDHLSILTITGIVFLGITYTISNICNTPIVLLTTIIWMLEANYYLNNLSEFYAKTHAKGGDQ